MSGGFGSGNQHERRTTDIERKNRKLAEQATGLDGRVTTVEGNITSLDGRLDTLEARSYIAGMGSVALNNNGTATSTSKADANVTAASQIVLIPSDSGAWSVDAGVTGVTAAAGSFTVSHTANTITRTFAYLVIR